MGLVLCTIYKVVHARALYDTSSRIGGHLQPLDARWYVNFDILSLHKLTVNPDPKLWNLLLDGCCHAVIAAVLSSGLYQPRIWHSTWVAELVIYSVMS